MLMDAGYLRTHLWFPLRQEDKTVVVVLENPRALDKVDDVRRCFPQQPIKMMVAIREDIIKMIDYFFGAEETKETAQ